jgi:hypothetical protein
MPLTDRALVVGINNYPGISVLSGAENDANDFYDWVTDPAGGKVDPKNAIKIISSTYAPTTIADNAEPANKVIEDFFTLVDNAGEANNTENLGSIAGKRVWLFFSGHGFAPSLDRSGVLTANATLRRVHNIAARMWADRLYEGGWFDEVILFQDACRNRVKDADLNPPFLRPRLASARQVRRRFYAFAASNDKIAKEVPLPSGKIGGVFTATLLAALRGQARDPASGAITAAQLKGYLQDNMSKLLSPGDLADDDVAKVPDVFNPDPFDIVAPPPSKPDAGSSPLFSVRVIPRQPGSAGRVLDAQFQPVAAVPSVPAVWSLRLPRGLYKAAIEGLGETLFQVTGGSEADGSPSGVEVNV